MAWTIHTDEIIDGMISTIGTPTGGLAGGIAEGYPSIWYPTDARLPCLFIEFDEMVNTPTEGRAMQEYRFNVYYCMNRRQASNPVRTARDRAEEIAASLAGTPRLGLTLGIENSFPTRISTHNDVQARLLEDGQDVIAVLVEFYVRVAA